MQRFDHVSNHCSPTGAMGNFHDYYATLQAVSVEMKQAADSQGNASQTGALPGPANLVADHTAAFANLRPSNLPMGPDIDTCLAHLKLLASFHAMKEEVGYTDGLWGIWNTRADVSDFVPDISAPGPSEAGFQEVALDNLATRTPDQKIEVLSKLREKRWAVFIARAAKRYEAWWMSMSTQPLTEANMGVSRDPSYQGFTCMVDGLVWTPTMLPPLGKLKLRGKRVQC